MNPIKSSKIGSNIITFVREFAYGLINLDI